MSRATATSRSQASRASSTSAAHASQLTFWPTPAAQAAALNHLRLLLEPLVEREGLTTPFVVRPGLRLRRSYGRCTYRDGSAVIQVRCTADADPSSWRPVGSITATLLHELAHLRYRSHGPRFWALYRRLVNRAEAAGLYDPRDRDPAERPRGERKLLRGRRGL